MELLTIERLICMKRIIRTWEWCATAELSEQCEQQKQSCNSNGCFFGRFFSRVLTNHVHAWNWKWKRTTFAKKTMRREETVQYIYSIYRQASGSGSATPENQFSYKRDTYIARHRSNTFFFSLGVCMSARAWGCVCVLWPVNVGTVNTYGRECAPFFHVKSSISSMQTDFMY